MRSAGLLYSPFSILATSNSYSFVADIRHRNTSSWIPLPINRLAYYNTYNLPEGVKDKLIIFCVGKRLQSYYISISDIPERCYTVGPYYAIELYHTTPLAALRKMVEENCY